MTPKRIAAAAAGAFVMLSASTALAAPSRGIAPRRTASLRSCKLAFTAEPHKLTAGEAPLLFGRLTCGSSETAGQTITIYADALNSSPSGSKTLGTATTTTGGYFSFQAPAPTYSTFYRAVSRSAASPQRLVDVAPLVTLNGPQETKPLYTGTTDRVLFSGTVSPLYTGDVAVLQRESSTGYEEWVPIQKTTIGAGGIYSFLHTFVVPGAANIRVLVTGRFRRGAESGASSPLSYVITQKENPLLTLYAASASAPSDPIVIGKSVALEGTVAEGAGKSVTLMARTALSGSFSTVATQDAGGNGQYKFDVSPTENTFYKVVSAAGRHSSVLFEGVKSLLTANPSTLSLPEGQSLTFTGTVLPAQIAHTIYLERENTPGTGPFHVVAVGVLNPAANAGETATYTLSHTVFSVGKQVYRVKVPGDRLNQGVASTPVTVEVTPAPASSLAPGLPINLAP